ncbi:MAG: hypothetical protein NWR72_21285 [Bacteroidia bacterium]|nr:hypothetical protein [Bacteroidia bacterium]
MGEPFHEVQTAKWRGVEKRDTLYSEAGYEWRGIILGMQEGKVVVEEDFFGKRTVNRIRVESPRFRTPLEVRVGDAAELLKARPFTWHLEVIPHYDRLDIFAEEFPSFHFLLPWTGDTTNLRPALSEVEGNIPIVGIVIM